MIAPYQEIENPFDCFVRELGEGCALFLIPGSMHSNPQFIVMLYDSGDLRVVDMRDMKLYGNPTNGQPLTPPIPDSWKKRSTNKNEKDSNDYLNRVYCNGSGLPDH